MLQKQATTRLAATSCTIAKEEREEEMEFSDRGMLKMEPSAKRTAEVIYG